MPATGRCHCGGVRFEATGELRDVFECHCDRCRRLTGHVMAATGCRDDDLSLTTADTLRWYEPSDGVLYGFCGRCGSTLFWRADGIPGWTSIAAGTLDSPTGLRTTTAWFVADRSDYVIPTHGLVEIPGDGRGDRGEEQG